MTGRSQRIRNKIISINGERRLVVQASDKLSRAVCLYVQRSEILLGAVVLLEFYGNPEDE